MPRYVVLFNWTDQGVRTAGESMRQQESQGAFQQMGLRLETVLRTQGPTTWSRSRGARRQDDGVRDAPPGRSGQRP